MFKLKRLEITGFKSFADHTDLVFTGEGITAVVGPNGCGKSNVADAIAWVLGEQRVKHLRGAEMKDVIFQGSRNRQPSGMAEVVLHMVRDEYIEPEPDIEDIDSTLEHIDEQTAVFEEVEVVATTVEAAVPDGPSPDLAEVTPANADSPETAPADETALVQAKPATHHHRHWRRRNLALEFAPGEAVSVTRRLYRSGESEYLLNDRPCRLRDIQDLFSGTGLAGGHYAIIEQGRIGQILSAKPMDRRTIIEEAAGITKFRVRQRAAEARLESARANLSRVSDIIAEIERQVNSLRRQAAKARRYRIQREELRELLRSVYVAEERSLVALLDQTQAQLDSATEDDQRLAAELSERDDKSRAATQTARALEDELAQVRAAVADAALQRDRRIRERVYQEEQIGTLTRRRAEIEREVEALSARMVVIESELERLRGLDATLEAENQQATVALRSAEVAHARKVAEVAQAENEIETARIELLTHTAAAERLNELARQLESALEKLTQQAEGLAREGERAAAAHAQRTAEAGKLNQEIGAAREKLAKLTAERESAVRTVIEGHERVSDTDAEQVRVRDDYSRALHRLESFKELDSRRAHYSLAVQEAFSANESEEFHLIGTLADAVSVDARWERAVEGVFGSSLQSILVPTSEDAIRAAAWLKNNQAGRATFLVTGFHGGSDEADVITFIGETTAAAPHQQYIPVGIDGPRVGDILNAPPELLTVLERILPERMNARIVDTLDDATALSLATGDMFVTTDGDWVAGGQFVNAGNGRALEEGAGLLTFKRELRELESRAENLAAELAVAEVAVKDARGRLTGLEESVVLLNASIARQEREVMARELNAGTLQQDVERTERHMRVVIDDSARLQQERRDLEESRTRTLGEAAGAETKRRSTQERIEQTGHVLAGIKREAEAESELLNQQRSEAAAAAERRRSTASDLRRLEAEREEVNSRIVKHQVELSEAAQRIDGLNNSISEIDRLAASVDEEKAREEEEIAGATVRLTEARERADALAADLAELNRTAAASRDARAAVEVQRAEAHGRVNFVRESCANELNQSLEEIAREVVIGEEFDLETERARVDELRERLENFGAVNMMALEELSESDERLAFLTTQRDDITKGIAATEEALREIKRRSRERFRDAFEKINQNFSELFKELFGGGRGEMSLIDTDDELESGIDIIAQPPGKRLQNVLLLSGGEKAMAALAMVLGIFHYRPSPFCLLDEVDAPLDEANIGRFTSKVVDMAANTQFIVITHNKRTMETARALYGVTMEEVGVSKLVSVRFE
ncbi:MAG TPA: chromosome segregation protein SMC [Pyrinomonadaceae bacterium]|nr:chromosome segregation protein SMC [Pyrinomonadaceae bacterium]